MMVFAVGFTIGFIGGITLMCILSVIWDDEDEHERQKITMK